LMVAQLKNQDMFSPMDNTQFLNQMAQFSMVNALMGMSEMSNLAYTTSLMGKMATVAYMNGGTIGTDEGIIESVNLFNGSAEVVINGTPYQLSNLMSINDTARPVGGNDKLTDYSGLIGRNATLLNATLEDGFVEVSGRITGIRLIDGKVHAIVGEKLYPLNAINTLNEIIEQAPKNVETSNTAVFENNNEIIEQALNNTKTSNTDVYENNPEDMTGTGGGDEDV